MERPFTLYFYTGTADYNGQILQLNFTPSISEVCINLSIYADDVIEEQEVFQISISSLDGIIDASSNITHDVIITDSSSEIFQLLMYTRNPKLVITEMASHLSVPIVAVSQSVTGHFLANLNICRVNFFLCLTKLTLAAIIYMYIRLYFVQV